MQWKQFIGSSSEKRLEHPEAEPPCLPHATPECKCSHGAPTPSGAEEERWIDGGDGLGVNERRGVCVCVCGGVP